METLREKLDDVVSGALPENPDNAAFCGNEVPYETSGFYEMMDKVMQTIKDHISP